MKAATQLTPFAREEFEVSIRAAGEGGDGKVHSIDYEAASFNPRRR